MHKIGIIYLFQFFRSHLYLSMTFNHTFLGSPSTYHILTYKKPSSDITLLSKHQRDYSKHIKSIISY